MPHKNRQKNLIEHGLYHAYNLGYEKRQIFYDRFDYEMFESIIREYFKNRQHTPIIYGYCLMPNHFHFLMEQIEKYDMPRFIQLVSGEYTRYFNWKYKKSGQLWQGTYRAVKIENEKQFDNVLAYIHNNALDITALVTKYRYSSYKAYTYNFDIPFIKKGRPCCACFKEG